MSQEQTACPFNPGYSANPTFNYTQNILGSVPPYAGLPPVNVALFEAKKKKGLTFDQIAYQLRKDEVWVAAAFYGQVNFQVCPFFPLACIRS